jgi:Mitochondrial K+-H+ exchange-related
VKIYMVLIDDKRFFFFADESELAHEDEGGSPEPRRSGIGDWILVRFERFKAAWQEASSGALYWMRKVWDWLHKLVRPDEAMLARLWSARRINLHHPAARSEVDVRAHWQNYLKRQWRRHLLWFAFNAAIAPPSVILAFLPGPNVIGFWFAYRAVHHGLVVWGITRARRNLVPIELHALESLDVPIEHDGEGNARHAALLIAGEHLDKHMAWWHGSFLGIQRGGRPASRTAPLEPAQAISSTKNPETGDHAPSEL